MATKDRTMTHNFQEAWRSFERTAIHKETIFSRKYQNHKVNVWNGFRKFSQACKDDILLLVVDNDLHPLDHNIFPNFFPLDDK
jgi:hypothetical protein